MNSKHIVITGGNKGIGLEATKLFLAAGHSVTVIARDFSHNESLPNCRFVSFDLRKTAAIPELVATLGDVDVLVNNAGIMNTCPYDAYPVDQMNDLLSINIAAPVALITALSAQMKARKSGRIVNVASVAGQIGHPDVWYGITKAGMINMTKSFAKLLGSFGIVVNAVAPSIVDTEMKHSIPVVRQEAVLKSVHSGRFAQAAEIAATIFWLATDSPIYMNGTCLDINDGSFPR